MYQVCAASDAVGMMIICGMMVIIHSALYCALTAASMTRMTSLTYILLVCFICNFVLTVSLNGDGQDDIMFIGRQSTRFDF